MADERTSFHIRHLVGQGVNFCFYLLGKAQIRLPALSRPVLWAAPGTDPFADFARRFEVAEAGEIEPLHLEPLWRPWLAAVAQTCPDSAADALSVMPELPARPYVRTTFQRFGRMQLNDFLERWTGVKLDLEGRLTEALRTFDVARILARHQQTLGVEYHPACADFLYHLLRVFAVSHFGAAPATHSASSLRPCSGQAGQASLRASCVLGAAYLEQPGKLADVVAHQTLRVLVAQTDVWERDDIRQLLDALGRILRTGYLTPRDAAEEALCILGDVLEHEGEAAPFERVEGRMAAPAMRILARAFYETRRLRQSHGFVPWIKAGLEQAARARPAG